MTETFSIGTALTQTTEVIPDAMSAVWSLATSNPLITFFLGVSILSLGFKFFRKARRTVG